MSKQEQKAKQKAKRNQATKKPPAPKTRKAIKKPPKKAAQNEIEIEIVVPIKTHKDKNGGHYHVIVDNVEDKHVSVGLTTKKKKGKNNTNYPLEKSPLGDGKTSYIRRQATVDSKNNYHSPRKGSMTPKDYEQAKVYGERAKQKYLKEKKNKKK